MNYMEKSNELGKKIDSGVFVPQTVRFCKYCKEKSLCDKFDKQLNQFKEVGAKLIELRRYPPVEVWTYTPIYYWIVRV